MSGERVYGCLWALILACACLAGALPSAATATGLPGATVTDSYGTVWHRIGEDDFKKPAPRGSWATDDTNKVVYVGDHGLRWHDYPDGGHCATRQTDYPDCYDPQHVLSVHSGVLDFYLHDCHYPDGFFGACGANPGPFSPATGTLNQQYGRYSARLKFVFEDKRHLDQYHVAWLLWPDGAVSDGGNCGESDFPEEWLSLDPYRIAANAFWHACPNPLSAVHFYRNINLSKWHVFTQEWGPGFRRYYIDRELVGESTLDPTSTPSRWQLQVEAQNQRGDLTRGHLLVDWVWLGQERHR